MAAASGEDVGDVIDGSAGAGGGGGEGPAVEGDARLLGLLMEAAAFEATDNAASAWNLEQQKKNMEEQNYRGDPEAKAKWEELLGSFKELEGDLWALGEQFKRLDDKRDEIKKFVEDEGKKMLDKLDKNNADIKDQDDELDDQNKRIDKLLAGQESIASPSFCITGEDTFLDSRGCLCVLLLLALLLTTVCSIAILKKFNVITINTAAIESTIANATGV